MANKISDFSPVPKWLQYRYAILYKAHKIKPFTQEQAEKDLGLPRTTVRVILSELRRAGWLEISLGSNDIRKFKYILRSPEQIYQNITYLNVNAKGDPEECIA